MNNAGVFSLTVNISGKPKTTLTAQSGRSILDILREHKIYVPAICGGRGTCGKCRIIKDGAEVLACNEMLTGDTEITVPGENGFEIVDGFGWSNEPRENFLHSLRLQDITGSADRYMKKLLPGRDITLGALRKLSRIFNSRTGGGDVLLAADDEKIYDVVEADGSREIFGLAVDIGTTTVCFLIVNLLTGEKIASHSKINRQREYGADVISRIEGASAGKLNTLRECITGDIVSGITDMCAEYSIEPACICNMVVACNTTMAHLLLGLECGSLGRSPFIPTLTDWVRYSFYDVFASGLLDCDVSVIPAVSAYVGGDITSGIVFCGGLKSEKPSLIIDLGTNGEMAVFSKNFVLCTSTAAGPAFEGGNISCGTGSIKGAIDSVAYEDGRFRVTTIGGAKPIGICGSGVLDAAACLVQNGIVEDTGYINDDVNIADGVTFTQKDIRELQLAKSAVRAGIEILLDDAGLSYEDIGSVFLAGGFGNRLNLDSAIAIGIIPPELKPKVHSVGNSSLGGCVKALLSSAARREAAEITALAKEINLSAHSKFNDLFMDYMAFPI